MADRGNREAVERGFAGWNSGDVEALLETIHPEVVWAPSGLFPGLGTHYEGHDGVRQFWKDFNEPWESVEVSYSEMRDLDPDSVLVHVLFRGRGRGGIEVEQDFGQRYRIRDGLLVEMHSYGTWPDALAAIGADPH